MNCATDLVSLLIAAVALKTTNTAQHTQVIMVNSQNGFKLDGKVTQSELVLCFFWEGERVLPC